MSMPTVTCTAPRAAIAARCACYLELCKPRIAALVLTTVAVSAFIGSAARPDAVLLFHTLLGTALIAASASALNQWIERASDARMRRTADRPLPSGRVTPAEVFLLGASAAIGGIWYLGVLVNWLAASVGLLTWFLYVVVYTPMKGFTPANTVVGAIAGAMPVLIGWTAAAAPLHLSQGGLMAAVLFFIVYLWQFPHFMAIAWIYREDYARAGLKMLPVVDPSGRRAAVQAIVAAIALLPVTLLPSLDASAGGWYLAGALALGGLYLYFSLRFWAARSDRSARHLLRVSLVYLPVLLALLALVPLI